METMVDEQTFDEWGNCIWVWHLGVWPTEYVCVSVEGPRGGRRATLRLTPGDAHNLALALMSVAKEARQAA